MSPLWEQNRLSAYRWNLPFWGVPTNTHIRYFSEAELMKSKVYEDATLTLEPDLQDKICRYLYLPPLKLVPSIPCQGAHKKPWGNNPSKTFPRGWKPIPPTCIHCSNRPWGNPPKRQGHIAKYERKFRDRHHSREWIGPKCNPPPLGWKPNPSGCAHCRNIEPKSKRDHYTCPSCDVPPTFTTFHIF